MSEIIAARDVGKSFNKRDGSQFVALADVSFNVRENEFLSIIGPSGCGKTTLLKMLAGLTRISAGGIFVDGRPVRGPGPERAMVFQNFVLLPWADVLTNAAFGLELRGVPRRKARERASTELARVGLSNFEHNYPYELSGGMQQRVGIARALAVDPRILLMDEPFGSLDAQTRQLMQDDLLQLWQAERKTVIFVTHGVDEAVYLSDRILVMDTHPGRVREMVEVPLPRPRDRHARQTAEFAQLTAYLWETLREIMDRDASFAGGSVQG
ncbi:MAG: ATP-binding cassette domain-containing protein [Dehalococcoidia bacterium]|nr:ATP-binding cassette domain-containing protein [Dehalococcoidia bacterium]